MKHPVNVSQKAGRHALAHAIKDLAESHGFKVEIRYEDPTYRYRSVHINVEAPDGLGLGLSIQPSTLSKAEQNAFVLCWHMVGNRDAVLRRSVFSQVNPHHGRKSTEVEFGSEDLMEHIAARFKASAEGRAVRVLSDEPTPA